MCHLEDSEITTKTEDTEKSQDHMRLSNTNQLGWMNWHLEDLASSKKQNNVRLQRLLESIDAANLNSSAKKIFALLLKNQDSVNHTLSGSLLP